MLRGAVHAQEETAPVPAGYPNKPIRAIVGSSPGGGGSDIVTRAMAQKLSERLDRPVVVDNRAGGNGVIAMNIVAQYLLTVTRYSVPAICSF